MARYECKHVGKDKDGNGIYAYYENGVEIYRDTQCACYARISGRLMARCENLEIELERAMQKQVA